MVAEQAPLPATLVIGAASIANARCVAWQDVPDHLPSSFQFATILVIPDAESAARQAALLSVLRAELIRRPARGTRVLWVLNRHSIPSIAAELGLGSLIELRSLTSGSVRALVEGLDAPLDELHYGIDDVSVKALELAYWRRADGQSRLALAASSADGRWLLIPPVASYGRLMGRRRFGPSPAVSAAVVLAALLGIAALAIDRTRATFDDYDQSVRAIGNVVWGLPIPDYDDDLGAAWSSPDAHMAVRLVHEHRVQFESILETLDPTLDPYELARRYAGEATATEYFALAAIAGDLPAAYRIATSLPLEPWVNSDVRRALTQSFWQTAVEQLHEHNFDGAHERNRVYLDASARLLKDVEYEGDLAPQRIRTLAYIVEREHDSGRIRGLCDDPDVVPLSFARLHTGYWGYRIPTNALPGLAERRALNRARSCAAPRGPPMDYRMLQDLAVVERHSPALCGALPIECTFVELRDRIFSFDPPPVTPELAHEVLEFAGECSYLSDDAAWMLLRAGFDAARFGAVERYRFVPGAVSTRELWGALTCAEKLGGDMNRILTALMDESPCELYSNERRAVVPDDVPALGRTLIERCGL